MQFPGVHYPVSSVPLILLWTLFVASAKGCLLAAVLSLVARGGKGLLPEFRHALRLIGVYGFAFFFLASFLFPTIHVELGWPRVDGRLLERAVWKTLGGVFYREAVPAGPGAAGAAPAPAAGGGMAGGTPVFDWQAAAFLVWVAGIFASSIKVAAGEASLRTLARGARKPQPQRFRKILARLAGVMGVGSEVTLLLSAQCRIPFTYRLRRPVIVLPPGAAMWPVERLKAVLAHELGHIKRGDFLTQLAARAVCSLFWFAPPVWLGYRSLCAAQESACDEMVVAAGVKGPAYAECILDLARLATGRTSAAGLHFSKGSLRSLEARIRVILGLGAGRRAGDAKETGPPPAPRAARPLQAGLVALCSAFVLLAAAADKVELAAVPASGIKVDPTSGRQYYVPGPNEELYGTWINLEYSGFSGGHCQKMVFDDWGFAYNYRLITDPTSLDKWTSTIVDKWTDSEGGVWYREFEQCPGFYTGLQLIRIREGGELLEWVYNYTRFPVESELNPDNITYRTYRRDR